MLILVSYKIDCNYATLFNQANFYNNVLDIVPYGYWSEGGVRVWSLESNPLVTSRRQGALNVALVLFTLS